ncbi:unnamed protein product [Caenorhabditis auriculariae]|uniref:C2H2-type domain-containing protein n=1 Tax=Caenorhabditis auriculariae TaxID=2777116 RepID=A0A8S1GTU9_9PELO|nr:unnamed protein product [Caenorhabditis auriculariae]
MSYHYQDNDRDYFEAAYLPQLPLPTHGYEFYASDLQVAAPVAQASSVVPASQQLVAPTVALPTGETNVVPYGWRPDWATSNHWISHVGTNPLPTVNLPDTFNTYASIPEPQTSQEVIVKRPTKSAIRESSKPFRCQICCKSFSQAANLTAHKRIHTGEKPFTCSVCHRPFSQSSSLVTHKRTHTGERPYPCGHCEKAFTDSSTLTKHLRTHTGQKPYSCPLCMMRFTQSGNLHRHMKTHKAT